MWKLLFEALLGRSKLRTVQSIVDAITAAVILLVPGAAAAIFGTAIYWEQARITPIVVQMVHHASQTLHLPYSLQQRPHRG